MDKIHNLKRLLPNLFEDLVELQDTLAWNPDNIIQSLSKWTTDFFVLPQKNS